MEVTEHHFCHILQIKSSHNKGPDAKSGKIDYLLMEGRVVIAQCMGEICGHILQLIVTENEYDKDPSLFFLRVEAISLILLESRTQQEKHPKTIWRQKTPPQLPPDLEWGQCGVKQLGETLSLSPALRSRGLREAERVMVREQGPSPHIRTAEVRLPRKTRPLLPTPAQGQGAHSSQRSGHGHTHG